LPRKMVLIAAVLRTCVLSCFGVGHDLEHGGGPFFQWLGSPAKGHNSCFARSNVKRAGVIQKCLCPPLGHSTKLKNLKNYIATSDIYLRCFVLWRHEVISGVQPRAKNSTHR
jgi:hypothetical protein